jgi:hypothetical protein
MKGKYFNLSGTSVFTSQFWDLFVSRAWDRTPAVFKNVCTPSFFAENDLFDLLCESSWRRKNNSKSVNLRFYRDGSSREIFEDYAEHLPLAQDMSLSRYSRRLTRSFRNNPWGIILNEINRYSPELWQRARELMWHLFSRVGFPGGTVTVDSFVGNYDRTPFGIHKDPYHVFTFPVVGEKVFHLWPFQPLARISGINDSAYYTHQITGLRDIIPKKLAPIELRASPGDMVYWPQSYWHIAHGGQGLNATVTLGLGFTQSALAWGEPYVNKDESEIRIPPTRIGRAFPRRQIELIHSAYKTRSKKLASRQFMSKLTYEYLRKVSAFGFSPPLEPRSRVRLKSADQIRTDPRFPILTRLNGSSIACFVNGNQLVARKTRTIQKLIALLNRGDTFTVANLQALCRRWAVQEGFTLQQREVRSLLTALIRYRGAEIVDLPS